MAVPHLFSLRPSRRAALLLGITTLLVTQVLASTVSQKQTTKDAGGLSLLEIDEELQKCSVVKALTAHKHLNTPPSPSYLSYVFSVLFPSSSPAINSILATLYISGPPNFLLAFCPTNIDPSSLSLMVAFAVGGLLGDTIFHLLPEIFLGEEASEGVRFILVEPNRNLLLGVGILVGFLAFMALERSLRIMTGAHSHSHSQSPAPNSSSEDTNAGISDTNRSLTTSAALSSASKLRKRNANSSSSSASVSPTSTVTSTPLPALPTPVKLGGYLNLIADFTHNITDGLALSTSFYASPTLGATTTLAVFFHEIPHEVGDFALLIQSGFSKRFALLAQFGTALGALLGTGIGIAVQEYGGSGGASGEAMVARNAGLWGTSLCWGDMLLPFTAGTFLYVGTVAVIPELLEEKPGGRSSEVRRMGGEFLMMGVGAGIMLFISWT